MNWPRSIAVVGLVRNGAAQVGQAVERLSQALAPCGRVRWLVVESDSSDGTADVLAGLQTRVPGFGFRSLGSLSTSHPHRTDRIARCRNEGLAWFDALSTEEDAPSHLLMADLDGVNDAITSEALASSWARSGWDACMANQTGRYYDLWALRHPAWCPADCWAEADFLTAHGVSRDRAIMATVYQRMIEIDPSHDWIEVDSAFGGLAIYRAEAIAGLRYRGLDANGRELCEHVPLHEAMRARGARLFINPRLLNGRAGDGDQYFPGPAVARRHVGSWRLRAALWLAFGPREGKALRRLIEGLR